VNFSSKGESSVEVRDHTALRHQEATVRLIHGNRVVRKRVSRKATMEIGGVQNVMWKAVFQARAQGTGDDLAVFGTRIDPSGDDQEALIGDSFQIPPQLVRASQKRDVIGMFRVGQSNDPIDADGCTKAARHVELVESQHPLMPAGQVVNRGAAHAAGADDDRVVRLHATPTCQNTESEECSGRAGNRLGCDCLESIGEMTTGSTPSSSMA